LIWISPDRSPRRHDAGMDAQVFHPEELRPWIQVLTSLGIGFLIGLERQRNPTAKAGVRTCALVAGFGAIAALLGQAFDSPWIVAAGLLVVGAMIIAAYLGPENHEADSGTTTVIAVVLCYCLGIMVWLGFAQLAVAVAITVAVLLHFKAELHAFSEKLAPHDVSMVLQFAVITFIVLPWLPDEGYGPYGALNPYHIWLMVVLVAGLGVAGYFALRLFGARRGLLMVGLLGGMVSSTATTLVHARQAAKNPHTGASSAAVIALSNLVVPTRLCILAAIGAPAIVRHLVPALALGIACGIPAVVQRYRKAFGDGNAAIPEFSNPASLPVALGFGALYAGVLLLAAWVSEYAGKAGLLAMAAVSGLVDVDAIALSSLRLFDTGGLSAQIAALTIGCAFLGATVFKLAAVTWVGGVGLMRETWPALVAPVAGAAAGLWLFASA
jgi:uncharacterized membrane protein (DUF4010 family)